MKFLKQSDYIRYVILKLSKYVKNQHADFLRFLFKGHSLIIIKDLDLVSSSQLLYDFMIKFYFCNITLIGQISLTDCVCFPSYNTYLFHA